LPGPGRELVVTGQEDSLVVIDRLLELGWQHGFSCPSVCANAGDLVFGWDNISHFGGRGANLRIVGGIADQGFGSKTETPR
jgi:hypothetical protein